VGRHCAWLSLVLCVLAGGCRDEAAGGTGRTAPPIRLATLAHDRFYLDAERGKPVVLVFWHTTCDVCKRELVELEALRRSLGASRVSVAGVLNDPENSELARRIVGSLALGFPTLLDEDGKVAERYAVEQFPTTIVVGPDGKIGLWRVGYTAPLLAQVKSAVEGYQ
jgi:peroxiredoxin